jgi:hypothetical protein
MGKYLPSKGWCHFGVQKVERKLCNNIPIWGVGLLKMKNIQMKLFYKL